MQLYKLIQTRFLAARAAAAQVFRGGAFGPPPRDSQCTPSLSRMSL